MHHHRAQPPSAPCATCATWALGENAISLFASQMQRSNDRAHGKAGRPCRVSATVPASTQLRFRQQMQQRQSHQQHALKEIRHVSPAQHLPLPPGRRLHPAAAMDSTQSQSVPSSLMDDDRVPPGCSRYTVELRKPMGVVLEEDKLSNIFVASVTEGGRAAAEGSIGEGDQLLACSGCISTRDSIYGETTVRSGEQVIRLATRGEDFATVMAAIRSHPAGKSVRLEFQRCQTESS